MLHIKTWLISRTTIFLKRMPQPWIELWNRQRIHLCKNALKKEPNSSTKSLRKNQFLPSCSIPKVQLSKTGKFLSQSPACLMRSFLSIITKTCVVAMPKQIFHWVLKHKLQSQVLGSKYNHQFWLRTKITRYALSKRKIEELLFEQMLARMAVSH